MRDTQPESGLSQEQYAAIATFRFELRRFLAFSEAAAAAAGLPPQQHQALLAIAGHAGPEAPTVGLLADQLLVAPHTAAELVSRMVASSLVTRMSSTQDRRRTELARIHPVRTTAQLVDLRLVDGLRVHALASAATAASRASTSTTLGS